MKAIQHLYSIALRMTSCRITTLALLLLTTVICNITTNTLALALSTSTTIRVCTGSSCLSKCRGAFNPKSSLEHLQKTSTDDNLDTVVKIEEVFCMNQCKRGPNMRIIQNENVITFKDESIMNDIELKRKSFQSVTNDARVAMVWGITEGLIDGSVVGTDDGPSTKLTDILPQT